MGKRLVRSLGRRRRGLATMGLLAAMLAWYRPATGLDIVSMSEAPRFARAVRRSNARLVISHTAPDGARESEDDLKRAAKLAADARSLNLFAAVEVEGQGLAHWCEPVITLSVARSETATVDAGSSLEWRAAALRSRDQLRTTVGLAVDRWDGAHKLYQSSGEAIVEYDADESNTTAQSRLTTRVTWAALKQFTLDTGFHLVAADRLMVTKPYAVPPARVARLVEEAARPFPLAEIAKQLPDCPDRLCVQSLARTSDGEERVLSRVSSQALPGSAVISRGGSGDAAASDLPVADRLVELSRPVPVTDHAPFGFCEVVTYDSAKDTRTIYTTCGQPDWLAHTELCHLQLQD